MYQATRIFASNLKDSMAQRFFNLVLFPRVRDDIAEYKRLNFHLYQALRKALFKPGAFMKGILLPLCEVRAWLAHMYFCITIAVFLYLIGIFKNPSYSVGLAH